MPKLNATQPSRGQQIIQLAAEGKTDKEIAATLDLSPSTIKTYWTRVRHQYAASSRGEAIAKAMREASTRHLRLIETMNEGVAILQDEAIQYANPAMGRIMGVDADKLVGLHIRPLLSAEDYAEVGALRKRVVGGQTARRRVHARRLDGSCFDAEISVAPIEWEGRGATVATVRDRSAEYLEETRMANILSALPDLLLVMSPEGIFLDYRESRILVMEESPERLVGKYYADVLPPEVIRSMTGCLLKLREGASHSAFYFQQSDEGSLVTYVCWMTPMQDGNVLASIRRTAPRN